MTPDEIAHELRGISHKNVIDADTHDRLMDLANAVEELVEFPEASVCFVADQPGVALLYGRGRATAIWDHHTDLEAIGTATLLEQRLMVHRLRFLADAIENTLDNPRVIIPTGDL